VGTVGKKALLAGMLAIASVCAIPSLASAWNPVDHMPVLRAGLYAEEHWPEEYAGWWAEEDIKPLSQGGNANFAFTDDAIGKVAELRELFPSANPYAVHEFEHSEKHLRDLQWQIVNSIEPVVSDNPPAPVPENEMPPVLFSTGVSYPANRTVFEIFPQAHTGRLGAWLASPEFTEWKEQWPPEVDILDGGQFPFSHPTPLHVYPGNSNLVIDPPLPNTDEVNTSHGTEQPSLARATTKNRKLVRKCNRARKSASGKKRTFAKSKKCRRARAELRLSRNIAGRSSTLIVSAP